MPLCALSKRTPRKEGINYSDSTVFYITLAMEAGNFLLKSLSSNLFPAFSHARFLLPKTPRFPVNPIFFLSLFTAYTCITIRTRFGILTSINRGKSYFTLNEFMRLLDRSVVKAYSPKFEWGTRFSTAMSQFHFLYF